MWNSMALGWDDSASHLDSCFIKAAALGTPQDMYAYDSRGHTQEVKRYRDM